VSLLVPVFPVGELDGVVVGGALAFPEPEQADNVNPATSKRHARTADVAVARWEIVRRSRAQLPNEYRLMSPLLPGLAHAAVRFASQHRNCHRR
jgi:hypothetical protein